MLGRFRASPVHAPEEKVVVVDRLALRSDVARLSVDSRQYDASHEPRVIVLKAITLGKLRTIFIERFYDIFITVPARNPRRTYWPDPYNPIFAKAVLLDNGSVEADEDGKLGLRDLQIDTRFEKHVYRSALRRFA